MRRGNPSNPGHGVGRQFISFTMQHYPLGAQESGRDEQFGVYFMIPFSSFHDILAPINTFKLVEYRGNIPPLFYSLFLYLSHPDYSFTFIPLPLFMYFLNTFTLLYSFLYLYSFTTYSLFLYLRHPDFSFLSVHCVLSHSPTIRPYSPNLLSPSNCNLQSLLSIPLPSFNPYNLVSSSLCLTLISSVSSLHFSIQIKVPLISSILRPSLSNSHI